jgi:hypothetical protein
MFKKYPCDVLLKFSLLHVLFFSLCFTLNFLIFVYVMYVFIYIYVYYNINIMNLKLEHCSSKLGTLILRLNLEHVSAQ